MPAHSGATQFALWTSPPIGHETLSEENIVTQAQGGGTQAANCAAPERTSPTSQRIHVTVCDDFPTTDYSESSKDPICLLAGNRRQDDL